MNLKGYTELTSALDVVGVDARIANRPKDDEDLRYITVYIETGEYSDEPTVCVADVMNAFVASGHIPDNTGQSWGPSYGCPELKLCGFTDKSILLEDTNARPAGSAELR